MKLIRIAWYLLLLGIVSSCIREDLSNCYNTDRLLLSYKGDGTAEIFPEKICRVEMYVFDAGNNCVASGTLPEEDVQTRTTTLPRLDPGQYRIVCLGNTHSTKVEGLASCRFDQIRFAAERYLTGETVSGNDSLYYASMPYTVEPYDAAQETETNIIEFASAHYKVSVEVLGVPASGLRTDETLMLELCNVSPCTDFENRACGNATTYRLESKYDDSKALLTARTNIMRHKNHEKVSLCVRPASGGEPLAEVNFAEFLAAHEDIIDCTKHEVLIPIRIEFKSGTVSISVPEWYIEDVKPEF